MFTIKLVFTLFIFLLFQICLFYLQINYMNNKNERFETQIKDILNIKHNIKRHLNNKIESKINVLKPLNKINKKLMLDDLNFNNLTLTDGQLLNLMSKMTVYIFFYIVIVIVIIFLILFIIK